MRLKNFNLSKEHCTQEIIMIYQLFNRCLVLAIGLLSNNWVNSAEVITGNTSGTSFSFNIGPHVIFPLEGIFVVGAVQAGTAQQFALALVSRAENKFRPLAPQTATINDVANLANPLFNASIGKIAKFGNKIVVVPADSTASLFLVDEEPSTDGKSPAISDLTAISGIANANSVVPPQILALETQAVQNEDSRDIENGIGVFLATANSSGNFNNNGAGIAYVGLANKKMVEKKVVDGKEVDNTFEVLVWETFDAQTGQKGGNRAAAIDPSTPAVQISNPVTQIGNIVDLHWDVQLARLYVALQVQAGSGNSDGGRAVLVGSVVNGQLVFQPIAPDTVFSDATKIVGVSGSLAQAAIYKVRTIVTSTHLKYLIAVGTSGDVSQAQRKVFALPLVDAPELSTHGTLAQVTSAPLDYIIPVEPFRFQARRFVRPAELPTDAYSIDSIPAIVGGGKDLPGDISDIITFKDAVFVSIAQSSTNQQAGIFYSQALFDSTGRINGWTQWLPAGTTVPSVGFGLDLNSGTFLFMPTSGQAVANTVLRTNWTVGQTDFEQVVSSQLPKNNAGVQGLFDFPQNLPSFNQQVGSRIALNVFTGSGKILILQSGIDTNAQFGPNTNFSQLFNSTDGSLAGFTSAMGLSISGGVLGKIGLITSCEIVSDGSYSWLVVGGTQGVAILVRADGTGWLNNPGLSSGFQGLTNDMSFVKLGNFTAVRKLTSIGNQLFVLTAFGLERIAITPSLNSSSQVLAQGSDFGFALGSLTDIVVSGPFALLGTSSGMFRSGNGIDITTVQNKFGVNWTQVFLPEAVGSFSNLSPIVKFYVISPTGIAKDVFALSSGVTSLGNQGNIYVLNGYVGYHQAQLYRFSVSNTNNSVSDQTVTLFPDIYTGNQRTFLLPFPTYRNGIATDGAMFFSTRNAYNGTQPFLAIISPVLRSGLGDRNLATQGVPLNIETAHTVGRVIRSSTTGFWLVNGDFGMRTNQ